MAEEADSLGVLANPLKLDAVLRAAAGYPDLDGGGLSVTDWLFNLKGLPPGSSSAQDQRRPVQHGHDLRPGTSISSTTPPCSCSRRARDDTMDQLVALATRTGSRATVRPERGARAGGERPHRRVPRSTFEEPQQLPRERQHQRRVLLGGHLDHRLQQAAAAVAGV